MDAMPDFAPDDLLKTRAQKCAVFDTNYSFGVDARERHDFAGWIDGDHAGKWLHDTGNMDLLRRACREGFFDFCIRKSLSQGRVLR